MTTTGVVPMNVKHPEKGHYPIGNVVDVVVICSESTDATDAMAKAVPAAGMAVELDYG